MRTEPHVELCGLVRLSYFVKPLRDSRDAHDQRDLQMRICSAGLAFLASFSQITRWASPFDPSTCSGSRAWSRDRLTALSHIEGRPGMHRFRWVLKIARFAGWFQEWNKVERLIGLVGAGAQLCNNPRSFRDEVLTMLRLREVERF